MDTLMKGNDYFAIIILPAGDSFRLIYSKPVMHLDASQLTVMRINPSHL